MTDPMLTVIANLTAALAAQDSATDDIAAARRDAVRAAVKAGHTFTDIAAVSGITRQRVAQLAKGE